LTGLGLGITPAEAHLTYRTPSAWLSGVKIPDWTSDALDYCYENCGVSYYCKEGARWENYDECREATKLRLFREGTRQEGKIGLVAKYRLAKYVGYNEHLSLCREAAQGGYDLAQYKLGEMLYGSDLREAVSWLAKAAEQGNPDAGNYLAAAYLTDSVVGRDEAKAIDYYRKSTGSDLAKAEYEIGKLYDSGWGEYLHASQEQALHWYERAAERSYTPALLKLSEMYFNGDGVGEKDIARAYDFASRASSLGDHETSYFLATIILLDRANPRQNVLEAISILKRLVEDKYGEMKQYIDSPFALGEIYSSREHGVYDKDQALKYYEMAFGRRKWEAKEKIRLLEHNA
jgi:TPR repeat protein